MVRAFQFNRVYAANCITAAVGDDAALLPASMGIGIIPSPGLAWIMGTGRCAPFITLGTAISLLVILMMVASPLLKGARQTI